MRRSLCALAVIAAAGASRARAQRAPSPSDVGLCLSFAFGTWTPPLDWHASGHAAVDTSKVPRASDGRSWATNDEVGADSTLMLYPAWWPAGIRIELSTRKFASGDTIAGRATAFVGDGSAKAPTTTAKVWRIPCGSRNRPSG